MQRRKKMRNTVESISSWIFSYAIISAILGGALVACIVLLAFVSGGESATAMAVTAQKNIMPWFILCAAVAVGAGLVNFYCTQIHALSLTDHQDEEVETEKIIKER